MDRRTFLQQVAKNSLILSGMTLGLSTACSRSQEATAKEPDILTEVSLSRISTCSIALNHLPAEKAFPIIAAAGYSKVDVHEKVHLLIFPDLCDPLELKEIATKNNLMIANLSTYAGGGLLGRQTAYKFHGWEVPHPERYTSCGFSSDDPEEKKEELKQLLHTIDLAVVLGARSIRVVPGNDHPETIDTIVSWFQRAAEYAAEKKVYMAFENHSSGIAGTPKYCVELTEKVGSPFFGVLYEPGNLMYDTGTDFREALHTMRNCIVHCHFKDCKPVERGYEMQHFGEGDIDFPWIVQQLESQNYEGDYALEYELHSEEPADGLKRFYQDFIGLFDRQKGDHS